MVNITGNINRKQLRPTFDQNTMVDNVNSLGFLFKIFFRAKENVFAVLASPAHVKINFQAQDWLN